MQLVVLGMGDAQLHQPVLLGGAASIRGRMAARFAMNHQSGAHASTQAADMFLMP